MSLVLLSGGIDSTVLLTDQVRKGLDPRAISFFYGQRHSRELEAARRVAETLGVPHHVIRLPLLLGSALTDEGLAIPEGHYTDESMRATVVPYRNSILLLFAAQLAASRGIEVVAYAAHAGDHAIYPDCRPGFVDAMNNLLARGHDPAVRLRAPFVLFTKADIVRLGRRLDAPLDLTWSCYVGGDLHCGRCGTCVERIEAFRVAEVLDPTDYEER